MRFGFLNRPGYVYAVRTVADPPRVKIGRTGDFEKRLATLSTSSPYDLEPVALWQADVALERFLHEHLAAHRVRGEWFDLGDDPLPVLLAAVASPSLEAYMDAVHERRREAMGAVLDRMEGLPDRHLLLVACHLFQGNKRGTLRQTPAQLAADLRLPERGVVRDLRALVTGQWLQPIGSFHQLGPRGQFTAVP